MLRSIFPLSSWPLGHQCCPDAIPPTHYFHSPRALTSKSLLFSNTFSGSQLPPIMVVTHWFRDIYNGKICYKCIFSASTPMPDNSESTGLVCGTGMQVVRGHILRTRNSFLRMTFKVFHHLSYFCTVISHQGPCTLVPATCPSKSIMALLLPLYWCCFLSWNVLIHPNLSYQTAAPRAPIPEASLDRLLQPRRAGQHLDRYPLGCAMF